MYCIPSFKYTKLKVIRVLILIALLLIMTVIPTRYEYNIDQKTVHIRRWTVFSYQVKTLSLKVIKIY